ncbi:MAG: C4-type zinc ribbon domain-containing protein [Propionibacteriaceae bacterium]|jgi:predicted  nucleic acid-binding Zn-ribbon protein|nr:C4-type zinc ribbon domain-containing protein [Propionibacteriaceae bacterium]
MKADPADLTRLLELQQMDTTVDHLRHQASSLPVHKTIATVSAAHDDAGAGLIAARTRLADAEVEAERAEADVVPVKQRLERNQARVDSGEVQAKALATALEEIDHLHRRISDLEDAQLAAMDLVETTNTEVATLTAKVAELDRELRTLVSTRDGQVAELSKQARQVAQERAALQSRLPAPLLSLYEKIRARSGGIGVARLEGRRCSGCGLEVNITDYNRYVAAAPDEVLRCAECDRILVR